MKKTPGIKAKVAAASLLTAVVAGSALGWHAMHRQDDSGPPQQDMALTSAMRSDVIDGIVSNLDRGYVFPDRGAVLGQRLKAQFQHGDFDRVGTAQAFARALTETLQRESGDKHLVVRYDEKPIPVSTPGQDDSPEKVAADLREARRFNFGVSSVSRLRGNMGYIDLHQFARPQGMTPRMAAALALLADTQALIVDLRHCGGGDPDSVMLFASYFYDQPTHLNDIYWRDENRTEVRWTQASVSGPRYGQTRQLYLLTSADTFSGCEDFAYAIKNSKRGTLVGETTGGGAHAGAPQRLSAHFMMFLPSGRPINPVTHTDWEGVGVQPDVKTSADAALDVAQVTALTVMAAQETDAVWKQKLQRRIADLK